MTERTIPLSETAPGVRSSSRPVPEWTLAPFKPGVSGGDAPTLRGFAAVRLSPSTRVFSWWAEDQPRPGALDKVAGVSAHPEQPRIVAQALLLSRSRGFIASCRVETGRLLATLAASRTGTLAEIGTGCGVGAAWIYSSMRPEAKLVTAEVDPELAAVVGKLFADDDRVTVLAADWRELTKAAPFSLLFVDSREPKKAGPDGVVDFLEPGGIAVLDDFTPTTTWPPMYNGSVDVLRQSWLTDPRFATSDVMVTDDACVLVATKL